MACDTIQGCTTYKNYYYINVVCIQIVLHWDTNRGCGINRGNTVSHCRAYDNGQSPDIFRPKEVSVRPNQIWPDNLLCIINGNFSEFAKNNKCLDNFRSLS